jgi:hypothetical protein
MRRLIFLTVILSGCSSNNSGGGSAGSQKSAAASDSATEIKLNWSKFSQVPDVFTPPVEHLSSNDGRQLLLIDKNSKSFLIDTDEKTTSPLSLWVNLKKFRMATAQR